MDTGRGNNLAVNCTLKWLFLNSNDSYSSLHSQLKYLVFILIKFKKEVNMENNELNSTNATDILNAIMEYELAGVVRYTHYSLMVAGPHRLPIVQFLKDQANESLLHAQQAGELLTGLDGHPSQKIAEIIETNNHSIKDILQESLAHEMHALSLYKDLLKEVEGSSVYLEEYARGLIGQEEQHQLELKKMLKDFS